MEREIEEAGGMGNKKVHPPNPHPVQIPLHIPSRKIPGNLLPAAHPEAFVGISREIEEAGGKLADLEGLFTGEENVTTGIYRKLIKKHACTLSNSRSPPLSGDTLRIIKS